MKSIHTMDSIDSLEFLPCADLDEDFFRLITDLSNNTDRRAYTNTISFDERTDFDLPEPIPCADSQEETCVNLNELFTHFQTDSPPEVRAISDFRMHSQQGTSNEPIIAPAPFDVVASQTSRELIAAHACFRIDAAQRSSEPITALARFDVVNGRGQGNLRLSGNKIYRELVRMNKHVYAKCHEHDKRKVSKGIVDAIREFGGRFLEYNKQSRTYFDIGDKKALGKTSQSLREGLRTIRLQIYSDLAAGRPQTELEAELLGSFNAPLPAERYFEYSIRMLQSLNNA
ncbi:hypothetical protein ACHAW5_009485 [Stephanodiscus triporus]|uniref:DUF6824 domain-containing protein n=1 Tax=Stephanodiscus triporus TaxID=2934178 RepID=A0ABD3NI62_9STRA